MLIHFHPEIGLSRAGLPLRRDSLLNRATSNDVGIKGEEPKEELPESIREVQALKATQKMYEGYAGLD